MTTAEEVRAQLTAPGGVFEIAPSTVRGVPMRTYAAGPRAMRDIFLASEQFEARDFIVWYDERYTFREHFTRVVGLAAHLRDVYGVQKGDRVAIAMRNYPEFLVAFWAVQALGAVAVPLNAWWTGPELAYGLNNSGAGVLFADGERLDRVGSHLADLPGLRSVISVRADRESSGIDRFEDLMLRIDRSATMPDVLIDIDDPATIIYTSGTTGRPKGAVDGLLLEFALAAQRRRQGC